MLSEGDDQISYRELVESANTIVLREDLQGRITFINDFGLELFGYRADELLGRPVVGTIVPETDSAGRNLKQMIDELLVDPDRSSDDAFFGQAGIEPLHQGAGGADQRIRHRLRFGIHWIPGMRPGPNDVASGPGRQVTDRG